MTELLTAAQMRAVEQAAIDSGQVTGLELMERAGRGVVEAILQEWPELRTTSHRAVVLCGPGNNGGDGYVVARLLQGRGWQVRVLADRPPKGLPPDAAEMARLWQALGPVEPLTEAALRAGGPNDLYIDAVFGTGLTRPPEGEILRVLTHLGGRNGDLGYYRPRLVAVDAPSGLCLDSGRMLIPGWARPTAALTVTFHAQKAGHVLAEGPQQCGRVVVADIGLAPGRQRATLGLVGPAEHAPGWTSGSFALPMLGKAGWVAPQEAHKYAHGHALVLAGGPGRGGAGRLAARGALRGGAGLVTLGCPPEALPENAARLDAVMLRPIGDADVLARELEDRRINALCLGPGMGTGEREAELLAQALASGRNQVLDADALTLLARDPALVAALHPGCVLTPHAGEFARLFPDIAERLAAPATKGPAYSKVDATREAAARAGCVVLFKGPDTVIADPSGRCAINSAHYDRAASWLATAGSGDVLAGLITGLLARGFSPFDAACTGAWLHVECALSFGPGLIAEDLPEQLPKVFRALGL